MKFVQHLRCLSMLLLTVALAACSSPTIPPAPTLAAPTAALPVAATAAATTAPTAAPAKNSTVPTASIFSDPFAYCAAVVNIDQPGPNFVGLKMPDAIAAGLKKATGASADAPIELFTQNALWRCMGGKVYACTFGANLPCDSKANVDKTPSSAETDYCKTNPNQDIPAYVTGHDTIYTWNCSQQSPTIQKQVFTVDARGYISEIWYLINPQ